MSRPPPAPPAPRPLRRRRQIDAVDLAVVGTALGLLIFGAGGALLSRFADNAPAHAMRALASPPRQIGQAGDCPIFHSRGADGSDITILICRPGASPKEAL